MNQIVELQRLLKEAKDERDELQGSTQIGPVKRLQRAIGRVEAYGKALELAESPLIVELRRLLEQAELDVHNEFDGTTASYRIAVGRVDDYKMLLALAEASR